MNPPRGSHNLDRNSDQHSDLSRAEETLRLVATLPPPPGLVDRIQTTLASAPHTATVLTWRAPLRPAASWMHGTMVRGAAAAAIVCVVAGGGWRIYSRVQPAPTAKVLVMPAPAPSAAFSTGNAMRVPQTLERPVLAHPLPPQTEPAAVIPASPSRAKAAPAHPGKGKKKAAGAAVLQHQ